ncbi:MAG: flagellar filament capping protein FliD [Paraclostridium sp.]
MKVYTSTNKYKINDIKTNIETQINNKNENNNKNEFYRKEINKLLLEFVKTEFDFLDIVVGIKDINRKYFDESSPKNIIKENKYYKNLLNDKDEEQEYLSTENDLDFGLNLDFDFGLNFENIDFNIKDEYIIDKTYKSDYEEDMYMKTFNNDIKGQINSVEITDNMKEFINDYNSLMDKVKIVLNENKINIKKDIEKEEIQKLLKFKNNQSINERKIKKFISETQANMVEVINEMGKKISQVGIDVSKEQKNLGIEFDEEKYKKAIEENGRGVYKLLIGFEEDENTPIRKFKKTFEKYSKAFENIFIDGIKSIDQKSKIIDVEEIKKQEEEIKRLMDKMYKKEVSLGSKFNTLKSSLEKCENQIVTLA